MKDRAVGAVIDGERAIPEGHAARRIFAIRLSNATISAIDQLVVVLTEGSILQ